VTRPAMNAVLLTGQPKEFAGGLISVFAVVRRLGLHAALVVQAVVTLAAVMMAARTHKPAVVLVLAALASPYLHVYDLLGVTLAVALLIRDRLERGFYPGEPLLFFVAWFGPGAMPWSPAFAHLTPLVLLLLLASAAARGRVRPCDSTTNAPGLSAGP
jgi:alpha-1,2-mannosyltransferase